MLVLDSLDVAHCRLHPLPPPRVTHLHNILDVCSVVITLMISCAELNAVQGKSDL